MATSAAVSEDAVQLQENTSSPSWQTSQQGGTNVDSYPEFLYLLDNWKYVTIPRKDITMSGIEIAGLALGIFPLVMKAIAGYADGCQKIDGKYLRSMVIL